MRFATLLSLLFSTILAASISAAEGTINTIQDYDNQLPLWGVSWAPGSGTTNGYYPSFYTGFAMRSEFPERIHVRLGRGNQTRVSVVLDQQTVSDYLFDLKARYDFYKKMTSGSSAVLNLQPKGGKFLPQLSYFEQIIESPTYGVLPFVQQAEQSVVSAEAIYAKGLEVLSALNPGRVFPLRFDLRGEFMKWRAQIQAQNQMSEATQVVRAIDSLLWGRINYAGQPDAAVLEKLAIGVEMAMNASDESFMVAALDLFKAVTGSKYNIKVLNASGQLVDALQCDPAGACTLTYPEFTTIYPTGSVKGQTSDQYHNSIANFATPGLWQFINRSGGRGVDNIRKEPYYGWIPKMDYQEVGNGFHNPAVRFAGASSSAKEALGVAKEHSTIWTVMRGGVSHGCSRLPVGHIWEMRHIFPVEPEKMAEIHHFGNLPQDFDVYDINGDGQLEVMGVEYLISYGLQSTEGLGSREGTDLQIDTGNKINFYTKLYGAKNVFTSSGESLTFINPSVSLPSYLDDKKVGVKTRVTIEGNIPLYEQTYEKDKVQFYSMENKSIVRLMGRVRGCAPASDKVSCGQAAFQDEAKQILGTN